LVIIVVADYLICRLWSVAQSSAYYHICYMDTQKIVGASVRRIRQSKKLSQEKLAYLSELDRTYIQSIEKGKRNISIKVLFQISKALNVSILELIKDIENEI